MPVFEYVGPHESVEVDEGVVAQGGTVEVSGERAETFTDAESWREKKSKARPAKADNNEEH